MKCASCGNPYKKITMELTIMGPLGKKTFKGCGICTAARILSSHNFAKKFNPEHAAIAEKMAETGNFSFEDCSDENKTKH